VANFVKTLVALNHYTTFVIFSKINDFICVEFIGFHLFLSSLIAGFEQFTYYYGRETFLYKCFL